MISEYILAELERKLRDKFDYADSDVRAVTEFLRANAQLVDPEELPRGACRDREDMTILGTATAGEARILITVDRDLLELAECRGIAIIKRGEYWRRLAP